MTSKKRPLIPLMGCYGGSWTWNGQNANIERPYRKNSNRYDTRPENILCLTYTDAGAMAMRRRLISFIGPDAYKVNISTFHAFCNDIIQENLFLFDKTALDAVSELERIALLKDLIDKFPKDHPLKRYRGDVYFETKNLKSLFSIMKREGWTPAFVSRKIDDYLQDIEMRDEFIYKRASGNFKAGDKKQDKINDEKNRMENSGPL